MCLAGWVHAIQYSCCCHLHVRSLPPPPTPPTKPLALARASLAVCLPVCRLLLLLVGFGGGGGGWVGWVCRPKKSGGACGPLAPIGHWPYVSACCADLSSNAGLGTCRHAWTMRQQIHVQNSGHTPRTIIRLRSGTPELAGNAD